MIELTNVSLSYGESPVLTHINCTLRRNAFTCIIGKNGSGKSTLLRAAAGLSPYSGSITLGGTQIRNLPHTQRARRIAYLPQLRPVPTMDVKTLIAHGRYPHLGFSKTLAKEDWQKIEHAAFVTGTSPLLDRKLATLSGGERQRAYIAMMVAQDADMMFLDEPATHLDIGYQIEILDLLRALHQDGKGIVIAAHDLPQAFHYGAHILLIAEGKIAAEGSPDDFCSGSLIKQTMGISICKADDANELYAYRMIKGDNIDAY